MKTKLSLVAVLLLFFWGTRRFDPRHPASATVPAEHSAAGISILSWNIGYFDFERDSRAQDTDLWHVATVIKGTTADCVTLQEIASPFQVKVLSKLLRDSYPYHFLGRGARTDRYVATLSKVAFEETASIPTSIGRDAAQVRLRTSQNSPLLTIVNCHADAFNSARRRHYVGDLISWHLSRETDNIILAGDFNFDLTPSEGSDLFTDSKKNDSESYSLILRYFRDAGRYSGPTASFDRRIDYVFTTGPDLEQTRLRVLPGKLTGKMDHQPLLAELTWKRR